MIINNSCVYFFTLITVLFTPISYARSLDCSYSEESKFQEHKDKLKIKYELFKDSIGEITFSVPEKISNTSFSNIAIRSKNEDRYFFLNLETGLYENEFHAYLNANKKFLDDLVVIISYDDGGCGQKIFIDLKKHNKAKNLHSLRSFGRAKTVLSLGGHDT